MVYHKASTDTLNTEWQTPPEVFDYFNRIFNFELDAAANADNAKCLNYWDAERDGLQQSWAPERVWLNPPYDSTIGMWMDKAFRESMQGALVVALVKHASDTKWWDIIEQSNATVMRIRGRVHFEADMLTPVELEHEDSLVPVSMFQPVAVVVRIVPVQNQHHAVKPVQIVVQHP